MDILNPSKWGEQIAEWINGLLIEFALGIITSLQNLLIDPPNIIGAGFLGIFYGNMLGVMPLLAFVASFTAIFIAIVIQRRTKNALQVVVIAIVVLMINSGFFIFTSWLYNSGTELARGMQFAPDEADELLLNLPIVINLIATIAGVNGVLLSGAILWGIMLMYAALNVSINFWFLPALTFYALGEWAKKFVKFLISLMLVTMLLGRMAAVFIIEVGKSVAVTPGFNEPIIAYGVLIAAILIATIVQPLLIWACYAGVSYVISKSSGRSWIRGKVKTENNDSPEAIRQQANAQHALATKGGTRPVPVEIYEHSMTTKEQATLKAKQFAIDNGSTIIATGAATLPGGAVTAPVIKGAGMYASHKTEGKANRKSREKVEAQWEENS